MSKTKRTTTSSSSSSTRTTRDSGFEIRNGSGSKSNTNLEAIFKK